MLAKILKNLLTSKNNQRDTVNLEKSTQLAYDVSAQERFFENLLFDFFKLMHTSAKNNFDHNRFGYDGIDHSNTIYIDQHARYLQLYFSHRDDFFSAYTKFKDQDSRDLFYRLILYRLLGHAHVAINADITWENEVEILEAAKKFDRGVSALNVGGIFGQIRHHEGIPTSEGRTLSLDCWNGNLAYNMFRKQYYFSRGTIEIAPEKGDIAMDLGACFGDTAVYFADSVGPSGHVYCFDPLPAHNKVVDFNIKQNNFEERITAVPYAVGDRVVEANVQPQNDTDAASVDLFAAPGFSLLSGNTEFPVTSIDAFAEQHQLKRVDFIKMDIEGFELPALIGAKEVITRFRPKLAISLYHKPLDMVEIPLWLAQHFPDYDLYLDHYTIHQEETVLYGISRPS